MKLEFTVKEDGKSYFVGVLLDKDIIPKLTIGHKKYRKDITELFFARVFEALLNQMEATPLDKTDFTEEIISGIKVKTPKK